MIGVKDEATPFLAKMLERAENKTKLLTYVRKYSGDLAQRIYQEKIKQTPFAPASLKRGRIPGTFDFGPDSVGIHINWKQSVIMVYMGTNWKSRLCRDPYKLETEIAPAKP